MHAFPRPSTAALASLALAAGSHAANQVYVVDDVAGPGVDFTSIQAAINAAVDGDVILIENGNYPAGGGAVALSIGNKSLTLVAEAAATVNISGRLNVTALAAGKQVALRGLKFQATNMSDALTLSNVFGSVWIEDCTFTNTTEGTLATGNGIRASNCASVVLARCKLTGSAGTPQQTLGGTTIGHGPGSHGLASSSSSVCAYDCQFEGGDGHAGFTGGDGANLAGGFLFASGCTFGGGLGGEGSDGDLFDPCTSGATGGDGVHLDSGTPFLSTLACSFDPGLGGAPGAPGPFQTCSTGLKGLNVRIDGGTHTPLAGAAHHLAVSQVVREGQLLFKQYGGPPGELVFVDYSGFQGFTYFEAFRGVFALSLLQPFFTVFEGAMPGSGTFAKTTLIKPLAPGTEGATIYLQSGFFDLSTGIFQGAPSLTVLLDSSL